MTGPMIGPDRDEVLAAVFAVVHPFVRAARAQGPLPRVDSTEFAVADWITQVAALLVLAEAWVVEDPRQAERRELRAISLDIHGGEVGRWREFALNHIPDDEMRRRRAAPGPMTGGTAA